MNPHGTGTPRGVVISLPPRGLWTAGAHNFHAIELFIREAFSWPQN